MFTTLREADRFVRHYEDAARVVGALHRLPPSATPAQTLADDMLSKKDVAALPSVVEPSLVLDGAAKRDAVEQAYARIAPMFWGPRVLPSGPLRDSRCRFMFTTLHLFENVARHR